MTPVDSDASSEDIEVIAKHLFELRLSVIDADHRTRLREIRRHEASNLNANARKANELQAELDRDRRFLEAYVDAFFDAWKRAGCLPPPEAIDRLQRQITEIASTRHGVHCDRIRRTAVISGRSNSHAVESHVERATASSLAAARRLVEIRVVEVRVAAGRGFQVAAREQATIPGDGTLRVMAETFRWDLFVCHASEDKDAIVRPLVAALREKGLKVWYDEFELTLGDSLLRKIDEGLANSRYGLVVLSRAFFSKKWPKDELDGLTARERNGEKVILPLWHGIDHQVVGDYSPILAGRVAAKTDEGIESLVGHVMRAMHVEQAPPTRGGVDTALRVGARQRGGAWASVVTLLSPEARRVADWLFDHDTEGLPGTPSHLIFTIASDLEMEEQDCGDACRELKKFGLADVEDSATATYVSANHHTPFVVTRDLGYNPADDDWALGVELGKAGRAMDGAELEAALHLPPNRINRAAWRLKQRGKIDLYSTIGTAPYAFHDLKANFETRQAVKRGSLT